MLVHVCTCTGRMPALEVLMMDLQGLQASDALELLLLLLLLGGVTVYAASTASPPPPSHS